MIKNIISLIACLILIIFINPKLIFIFSIFLIFLIINNYFFPNLIGKKYDAYLEADIQLLSLIKELSLGFFTLKIFNVISNFKNKIFKSINNVSKNYNKAIQLTNLSGFIASFIISLLEFTTVFYSGYLLISNKMDFAAFLLILQLSSYITQPVIEFINDYQMKKSISQIITEFNIKEIVDKTNSIDSLNVIKIQDLSFSYNESTSIFKSFSYQFDYGKKYLLVGKSGCGKSTLLKLLTKQFKNYSGDIIFNDQDIHDISEATMYKNVSMVSQDVFIFNDNLEDNIFMGKSHTQSDFLKIIDLCKLNDLFNKHGMEILTSDNINISGGEKSKIGLARAIVSDKPFIFLDEILSALDIESSKEIESFILSIKDKCIINICHKPTKENIKKYDYILDLNELN